MKEKFILTIVLQTSAYLFSIITNYIFLLIFEVELLGIWAFINSIINLCFLFINIGFDFIHFQYSGKQNFNEYFGTFFVIKIILLITNLGFTFFLIILFQIWTSVYFLYVVILSISKIIFFINNIFIVNLKTKIKIFKVEFPNFIISLGRNFSILYLVLNYSNFADPILFLCISYVIFEFLFLGIILFLSKNELKINKFDQDLAKGYLKDTRPIVLSSILLIICSNIGNIILNYSFGPKSLGYFYFINNYIIQILSFISSAFITLYLAIYSQLFEKNQIASIKNITHLVEKYSSIFFLSIIIIVFLNAELIFSIFLPKYLDTLPILYIMIFIPYFLGIVRPYALHMVPGKKQAVLSSWNNINLIITIILLIILIPKKFLIFNTLGLGVIGYAIALLIPTILGTFVCHYFSKKYFNIPSQKSILLHILLAFLSLLLAFLLKQYFLIVFFTDQLFLLIFSTILALLIFIGILFVFNQLNREDIRNVFNLLKFSTYKKSLIKEFSVY